MARNDNEGEFLHILPSEYTFLPLGPRIFKTEEGHPNDRISHNGGISFFVVNLVNIHLFEETKHGLKTPPWAIGRGISHLASRDINQVQAVLELFRGNRFCQHVCCILESMNLLKQQLTRR